METLDKKSILEMGQGAFMEIADYGMAKLLDDIMDPNTQATSTRTLTITLKLTPNEQRSKVAVECNRRYKEPHYCPAVVMCVDKGVIANV